MGGTGYDEKTVAGVKRFQARHGLAADGVIGRGTVSTMNVSVDTRIRQILINMERYRWLNTSEGERLLAVNIAHFRILGIKNGSLEIAMPAIVGKEYHETPVY
jgi:murein L,D-transpeptidase YcbB/YkuD